MCGSTRPDVATSPGRSTSPGFDPERIRRQLSCGRKPPSSVSSPASTFTLTPSGSGSRRPWRSNPGSSPHPKSFAPPTTTTSATTLPQPSHHPQQPPSLTEPTATSVIIKMATPAVPSLTDLQERKTAMVMALHAGPLV